MTPNGPQLCHQVSKVTNKQTNFIFLVVLQADLTCSLKLIFIHTWCICRWTEESSSSSVLRVLVVPRSVYLLRKQSKWSDSVFNVWTPASWIFCDGKRPPNLSFNGLCLLSFCELQLKLFCWNPRERGGSEFSQRNFEGLQKKTQERQSEGTLMSLILMVYFTDKSLPTTGFFSLLTSWCLGMFPERCSSSSDLLSSWSWAKWGWNIP